MQNDIFNDYMPTEEELKKNKKFKRIVSLVGWAMIIVPLIIGLLSPDKEIILLGLFTPCASISIFVFIFAGILKSQIIEKEKLLNGKYEIRHEIIISKNYDKLDEISEFEEDKARITLIDDNGNKREISPRTTELVDAEINDEVYTLFLDDIDEPIAVRCIKYKI